MVNNNWTSRPSRSKSVTSTSRWRRLRLQVLKRDDYQCRMRLPGCTGEADQVDHVLNVARGGNPYDEENCRSVCRQCHQVKSSQEAAYGRARRKRAPRVHPADVLSAKA
jgi:5-methylcytosine-specific restriction enzyme A